MKKQFAKVALLGLAVSLTITSCRNDDNNGGSTPVGIAATPDNFQGVVGNGETVTLDASQVYNLTGSIIVEEGGVLNIPAGTKITASGGTSAYITVKQGGKIYANGTANNPIVFTSNSSTPGSWGGIVICGKAPINSGTSATSEVGNGVYGGNLPNDNSGSLNFVRIEYAGATFTTEKEFNGLSLFGVGNQTNISNVSIINGTDDGIEFFGGTVNVSNIVTAYNQDDAFDWTEGWTGAATNIYAKRQGGHRGFEGDNNTDNHNANPRSNPTISNVTLIGENTGDETEGMMLRVGTYATIDNVVLAGWEKGITMRDDATINYFNGTGKITNVKFINVNTENDTDNGPLAAGTYTINNDATGAGNGVAVPSWAQGWAGL